MKTKYIPRIVADTYSGASAHSIEFAAPNGEHGDGIKGMDPSWLAGIYRGMDVQ